MTFIVTLALLLSSTSPATPDTIEESARRLEQQLIAPCCWRQPLAVHDSADARILKEEIRRQLREGRTENQILAAYEERYGIQILAEPPREGFHWVLYLGTPLVLILSATALVALTYRWRARGRDRVPAPMVSPETVRRIEEEIV